MEFSTNQWVVLGLVLVLGWLLGLASRSGSGKWKRAYREEQDAHARYRAENEARTQAANERLAEIDRHAPLIGTGTAGAVSAAARGQRDDLTRIRGVDSSLETRLNESGIHRFRDIARMDRTKQAALEGRLGLDPGRIDAEAWRDQAALLESGRTKDRQDSFG